MRKKREALKQLILSAIYSLRKIAKKRGDKDRVKELTQEAQVVDQMYTGAQTQNTESKEVIITAQDFTCSTSQAVAATTVEDGRLPVQQAGDGRDIDDGERPSTWPKQKSTIALLPHEERVLALILTVRDAVRAAARDLKGGHPKALLVDSSSLVQGQTDILNDLRKRMSFATEELSAFGCAHDLPSAPVAGSTYDTCKELMKVARNLIQCTMTHVDSRNFSGSVMPTASDADKTLSKNLFSVCDVVRKELLKLGIEIEDPHYWSITHRRIDTSAL
jgi:hypothetical protein